MNEDFVTYELAVKLKEKGFNEPCYGYYHRDGGDNSFEVCGNGDCDFLNSKNQYRVAAPTITHVLNWLREEKCLHIEILHIFSEKTLWDFEVAHIGSYERWWSNLKLFDTYEQAAIAGIKYILDNLI
jgi:hypothetical protein